MKTNESVILAHGWRKWYNGESSQRYSKKINNEFVIICLGKDGDYWVLQKYYNTETFVAIAEEMKLLNIETAKSKDKDSVYDLLDSLESDLSHINNYEEFKLDLPYLLGWLKHIRDICKEQNM
jgi:hypothetical protein